MIHFLAWFALACLIFASASVYVGLLLGSFDQDEP